MIHHDLDLFYIIYNTINGHDQRKTHYLSSIPIFLTESKSSFIFSSASSLIMILCYHFLNALNALHHYLWKKEIYCYC